MILRLRKLRVVFLYAEGFLSFVHLTRESIVSYDTIQVKQKSAIQFYLIEFGPYTTLFCLTLFRLTLVTALCAKLCTIFVGFVAAWAPFIGLNSAGHISRVPEASGDFMFSEFESPFIRVLSEDFRFSILSK